MSPKEVEANKVRAWKARAKGKPMRWRILRDIVAVLSQAWMSTFQVQIAMRRLYALKNKTTRDMLEELEQEKAVMQMKDDQKPELGYRWGSTREGVEFWIVKTDYIPVSIVTVAAISASVNGLGGSS